MSGFGFPDEGFQQATQLATRSSDAQPEADGEYGPLDLNLLFFGGHKNIFDNLLSKNISDLKLLFRL